MAKLRPETVKLLRRIKRHILEDPRRFDMKDWAKKRHGPTCGTAACIAGWAVLISVPAAALRKNEDPMYTEMHEAIGFLSAGRDALGITKAQAERLFYHADPWDATSPWWPEPYFSEFRRDRSLAGRAKIAARRIEYFIRTDGTDYWKEAR